jgi:ribosomal protein RSM22 (predicted rRNA methylase)
VQLPAELRIRIEELSGEIPRRELAAAAKALSDSYRLRERPSTRRLTEVDALAYAATRMPATYGALLRVFDEIPGGGVVGTVHDIGAGTGTGAWAAREAFGGSVEVTCEEREPAMLALGRRLTPFAGWNVLPSSGPDLVLVSYVLGELQEPQTLVEKAWEMTRRFLVIVEPGTPKGYQRILNLRGMGRIVAPCPHERACPLTKEDWCHFAARIERTALHRQLKGGELSHEDEKFSYLILEKEPAAGGGDSDKTNPFSRILRHPQIQAGFIQLQLCAPEGLGTVGVAKRSDPASFKRARKSEWGDRWSTPAAEPR